MTFQSGSMRLYAGSASERTAGQMAAISDADLLKLDEWYKWAEDNYEAGGHWVAESYEPWELLSAFRTLDEVKEMCGLIEERAEDARNA